MRISTALAHPNIAFIKYWGNAVPEIRLPANGSISMNMGSLETITSVSENTHGKENRLSINGTEQVGESLTRLNTFLSNAGSRYGFEGFITVESRNNFPMGAGIASSASAYAALAIALNDYFQLGLSQEELSAMARLGSGSACRSVPSGITEWEKGTSHESSFAASIASPNEWDLQDCIVVIDKGEKKVSSTSGHAIADTSPLQSSRVLDAKRRLELCRRAILEKDFQKLAGIIELDSDLMHAVMMTSTPALHYWQPASLSVMQQVRDLRREGYECAYTMDAGSNVHIICTANTLHTLVSVFSEFPGVHQVIQSRIGDAARIISLP